MSSVTLPLQNVRRSPFPSVMQGEFSRPSSIAGQAVTLDHPPSVREAHYAGRRARDARRKALLGGFLVAQRRHKPDVHARLSPDIRKWLTSHRSKSVGEGNVKAVAGFRRDPEHRGLKAMRGGSERAEQARRKRTHRLILLGTWVLVRREKLEELRGLMTSELPGLLEQGKMVECDKALLDGRAREVSWRCTGGAEKGAAVAPRHAMGCAAGQGIRFA